MVRTTLTTVCLLSVGLFSSHAHAQAPAPGGTAKTIEQYAQTRPALNADHGVVTLPLKTEEPFPWRGVRDGVTITAVPAAKGTHASLKVSYTRTRGEAAGCALVFKPGTLAGLKSLEFTCRSNRVQRLSVCLKDSAGRVWNMGSFDMGRDTTRVELSAKNAELDRYQNEEGSKSASFDPDHCYMLTVLDINGYMYAGEPECEWSISDFKAVVTPATEEHPSKVKKPSTAMPKAEPQGAPQSDPKQKPDDTNNGAKQAFLDALNHHPERRPQAIASLTRALAQQPMDAEINLYLGLAHLWVAAEWTSDDPAALNELVLAEHFLRRAKTLSPADRRIDSWLSAAAIHRARIEHDAHEETTAWEQLRLALRTDPCFQGVAVGLLRYDEPRDSAAFAEGLSAMRGALRCADGDPSGANHPLWPHNVEGFLLALCQYEHKAGNLDQADKWMATLRARDDYALWPCRTLAESVRASWGVDQGAGFQGPEAPPFVLSRWSGVACVACHQATR
jgi:hypothetical protein